MLISKYVLLEFPYQNTKSFLYKCSRCQVYLDKKDTLCSKRSLSGIVGGIILKIKYNLWMFNASYG